MTNSESFTVGIEEEYLIVDMATMNLVAQMPPDLMRECTEELGTQVAKEFLQCQIEVGTKVCNSMQEVREDLAKLRATVSRIARNHDCLLMAASTHPFSYGLTQLTDDERYLHLAEELRHVVERLYISGMHVHVGISNDELRIDLMNQASYFIPHLLSLTTSSPFWRGENTGLKSYRVSVFDQLPRTRLPPVFNSYADYMKHVDVLVHCGVIEDATKIWWDLRPSWRYPTLELRICDMCTNIDDTIAVAAVYRCWLSMLNRLKMKNQRWRAYSDFLIKENRWRAQRYGIDTGLIDFGRREIVSLKELVEELIELTEVDAKALNCVDEVEHVRTILERGTSAHRQIKVYNDSLESGRPEALALLDVVKFIVQETLVGID
ncbi:MAG: carboxylate-amine ligase [Gammaproteobacteria bacterium]|nr:carboxylate-amine ligase [Gammaproteobacteria bacterium]